MNIDGTILFLLFRPLHLNHEEVENWSNLPMNNSKKMLTGGTGVGVKNRKDLPTS